MAKKKETPETKKEGAKTNKKPKRSVWNHLKYFATALGAAGAYAVGIDVQEIAEPGYKERKKKEEEERKRKEKLEKERKEKERLDNETNKLVNQMLSENGNPDDIKKVLTVFAREIIKLNDKLDEIHDSAIEAIDTANSAKWYASSANNKASALNDKINRLD